MLKRRAGLLHQNHIMHAAPAGEVASNVVRAGVGARAGKLLEFPLDTPRRVQFIVLCSRRHGATPGGGIGQDRRGGAASISSGVRREASSPREASLRAGECSALQLAEE